MSEILAHINIDYDALFRVAASVKDRNGLDSTLIRPTEWSFKPDTETRSQLIRKGEKLKKYPASLTLISQPTSFQKVVGISDKEISVGAFMITEKRIYRFILSLDDPTKFEKIELSAESEQNLSVNIAEGKANIDVVIETTDEGSPLLAVHQAKDGKGDRLFEIKFVEKAT